MSHPDLDAQAQALLMATNGVEPPRNVPADRAPVPGMKATPGRRALVKGRLREALRPVAEPTLDRLARLVSGRLRHTMRSEYDHLAATVEIMRAEHFAVPRPPDDIIAFEAGGAAARLASVETNSELMKSQIAALRAALDRLGQAIAPAAGLDGVPQRFAELREQLNALDRRLRATSHSAAAPGSLPIPPADAATELPTGGFDYVGFERRFRGDSATVLETLADRYVGMLTDHQPVLDFGCGRGELVDVLVARGIDARGVDPDEGMVAEAQGMGRAVHLGDGLEYLRALKPHSLGAVISVHVAEHLPLPVLVEFMELAASRLRPGGLFIAETPNPMSLIVLGNSYILDPTHVWPLHPSLLTFMAERAGFRNVDLQFFSPAEAYHLPLIAGGPGAPPWIAEINASFERLNHVLFGPQEYALVATTPPGELPG